MKVDIFHRRIPAFRTAFGACAFAMAGFAITAPPVAAQDLSREVQNLKRDIADLQRYVYKGQTGAPTNLGQPQSSDTTASGAGDDAMSGNVAARLQVRLQELERRMRETTGKVEEAEFRLRQMEQRLETAMQDVEFRLTRLEGGNPTPPGERSSSSGTRADSDTAATQPVIPVPGSGTTVISSAGTESGSNSSAPQGGTLGTLIVDAQGNVLGGKANPKAMQGSAPAGSNATGQSAPPAAPSAAQGNGPVEGGDIAAAGSADTASLPSEPQALYDYSLGLMRQGEYGDAEAALRVFLDQHSDHQLVSSALYWLGETHYVRNNYRDAAFSFVDVYSRYPKSPKAPDSLLKLGMSLNALGNKSEACSAFGTLQTEYPNARRAVLKLAEDRGAQYGC